jgi:hypothetical protein
MPPVDGVLAGTVLAVLVAALAVVTFLDNRFVTRREYAASQQAIRDSLQRIERELGTGPPERDG